VINVAQFQCIKRERGREVLGAAAIAPNERLPFDTQRDSKVGRPALSAQNVPHSELSTLSTRELHARSSGLENFFVQHAETIGFSLTSQAQRPGAREAWIAPMALMPGRSAHMRPRCHGLDNTKHKSKATANATQRYSLNFGYCNLCTALRRPRFAHKKFQAASASSRSCDSTRSTTLPPRPVTRASPDCELNRSGYECWEWVRPPRRARKWFRAESQKDQL
jgi:hypothetical protein